MLTTSRFALAFILAMSTATNLKAANVTRCQTSSFDRNLTLQGEKQLCSTQDLGDSSGPALEICPEATISSGYNDNAFRSESGTIGDGFVRFAPRTRLATVGTPYELASNIAITVNRQFTQIQNNYVDFRANARAGTDIGSNSEVDANVSFFRGHESRSSIENLGTSTDLPNFIETTASIGASHFMPVGLVSVGQTVEHRTFISDPGGTATGRDSLTYKTTGCFGPRLSKRLIALVVGNFTFVDRFDSDTASSANDNYNVDLLASVVYELTGVTALQVGLGWLKSRVLGQADGDVQRLSANAALSWRPTRLTRVQGSVVTGVQQTSRGRAGTLFNRSIALNVVHSLTPFVSLGSQVRYARTDVQGSDAKAQSISGRISAGYQLTNRAQINLEYQHSRRLGKAGGGSFGANEVSMSLSVAY